MNWNSHVQKIANKISRTLGVMNRLKRYLPISAMRLMYDSLILSHLQFGITNWSFEWDRISKLQKRALRIMTNSRYNAHTEPLLKQLHLLNVKDIFDVQCMKFWYKFVNKKVPNYFRDMFKYNHEVHDIGTRSHDRLHLYPTRTSGARNVLRHHLPELLNTFPNIWKTKLRPIAYIPSPTISNVTWLIYIVTTEALSIAIFATTYESDKSMKWELWFYGRPKSPTAAWVAVMATLGADGDLWVVAGSLDLVHDDVIKWKHFPRYWPFVRGIHRSRWIPHTRVSDAELWCFFIDLRLNKRLSKQSRGWWFETPSSSLWRHCNERYQWINYIMQYQWVNNDPVCNGIINWIVPFQSQCILDPLLKFTHYFRWLNAKET